MNRTTSEFPTGIGIEPNTETPHQELVGNQDLVTPTSIGVAQSEEFDEEEFMADINADIEEIEANSRKQMDGAALTNLRSKLADLEKDDWMYEAPRFSYK